MIRPENWKWFGHAGHLIVARHCQFHLTTQVGNYLISTVGEYWPERSSREINASIYDPAWHAAHNHLRGDDYDAAYMKRFGFENIGANGKYETLVFKLGKETCKVKDFGCGLPRPFDWCEVDGRRYDLAGEATAGHYKFCRKWAKKRRAYAQTR